MRHGITLRKTLLAVLIAGAAAGSLVLPVASQAQSAAATLQGETSPNTKVTATNTSTGLVRTTRSNSKGFYVLVGLPPGTYKVVAGTRVKHVTLRVSSTSTVNLNARELSAVNVVASALAADTKTSQVGGFISQQQIETLPQDSRNFLSFAQLVPGVMANPTSTGGVTLQGGAQKTNGVNLYINGISQKSDVLEGGINGEFTSQGNPFPQLAIGQYRVITSNYEAQYAQVTSAVVSAVTKTGTNHFHGQAFMDYTNSNRRAETPAEALSGKKASSVNKEYGFALGGPIIKNKAHFFVTDSQKLFNSPVAATPAAQATDAVSLLPSSVQAQFGPASTPFFENLFFGDVDWEPDENDKLELTVQDRREHQITGIGQGTAASAATQILNEVRYYDLHWSHFLPNGWENKLTLQYQNASFIQNGVNNTGIGSAYTYISSPGSFSLSGSGNPVEVVQVDSLGPLGDESKGQHGTTIKDAFTFSNVMFYGNNNIQIGARYQDLSFKAQDSGDSSAQQSFLVCPADSTNPNCQPGTGTIPYKALFADAVPGLSPIARTKDYQLGAYVQDNWTLNRHLTLNLGARWDIERNPSYLNFVTPANVVAALRGPDPYAGAAPGETYAEALARGGVNINDYISNGHNRKPDRHNFQPRLGFSYDLQGNGRHVIFGGAGRSYGRNLYNLLQLEDTKIALGAFTQYFSSAHQICEGTPCVPWSSKYSTLAGLKTLARPIAGAAEVDLFNNHIEEPYSDQFSLGMRNSFGHWNTSVSVVRVVSKDNLAASFGSRYPNGDYWENGIPAPTTNPIPGLNSLVLWQNGIETRNTEVLISISKPFTPESGWGVTVAYTHNNAYLNRDITQHYSFDEPSIFDYPFILSNAVPKNRLVVAGSVSLPFSFVFSGQLTLQTPTPYDGDAFFAFPETAPNGGTDLPVGGVPPGNGRFLIGGKDFGYRDLDIAISKNFHMGGHRTWYVRMDVMNVLNFHNYSDIIANNPNFFPLAYDTVGGGIAGLPRTVKFVAGFKF